MKATFQYGIESTLHRMKREGRRIQPLRWQAMDVANNPSAEMVEVLHPSLYCMMPTEDLDYYRNEIIPNLPWADDHFEERVCGYPLNPGQTWEQWPWATHADKSRKDQMFNHNYMERYWPKLAGLFGPTLTPGDFHREARNFGGSLQGIRHEYGDLDDLINLLAKEPTTRQAFLPIWFPEDTGDVHDGRKPCTLGYHFIMRDNRLHVTYYIRSCDLYRHFRDDIYLTVRLALHVLSECRGRNPQWLSVKPGDFIMHITSLHMFIGDYQLMFKRDCPR